MTWRYDTLGNLLEAGDPDSHYTYTYDTLNRVKTVDNAGTSDAPRVVLTYGYDKQGNIVSTSDDSGVTVASEYDVRNRLSVRKWYDAVVPAGETAEVDPIRIDFHYNAASRQALLERFSGLDRSTSAGRTVTTYYQTGLVDQLTHLNAVDAVLAGYDYDYDFGGLVVGEARTNQDSQYNQTITYAYDLNGQLVDADYDTQPDEHFEYDLNGNRIHSRDGSETSTYTTGTANQLKSDGIYRYEYDGEGNRTRKTAIATGAVTAYEYDHRNRLVSVEEGDAGGTLQYLVRFAYDVYGRRIAKVDKTSTTQTVYNGDNAWADITEEAVHARYLFGYGIDELLARRREEDKVVFYLTDRLGSVRDIADNQGSMVARADYSGFGLTLVQGDAEVIGRNLFASRDFDLELDLYFNRNRYYDPSTGRFTNQDPIGFSGYDSNLYRYTNNSPTNAIDPSGLTNFGEYTTIASRVAIAVERCLANLAIDTVAEFATVSIYMFLIGDQVYVGRTIRQVETRINEHALKLGEEIKETYKVVIDRLKIPEAKVAQFEQFVINAVRDEFKVTDAELYSRPKISFAGKLRNRIKAAANYLKPC